MTEEEKLELVPEPIRSNAKRFLMFKPRELPACPQKNEWYYYKPHGCVCSDGEPYYSTLKLGEENKLLVMFCGGGVALDAYGAARPNTYLPEPGKDTFYVSNTFVMGYFTGHNGVANKDDPRNPFRNWSVVVVSYGSGDFHCGDNDFEYDDAEMGKGVCRHRGYRSYRAMLEKIKELVPEPEKILVTGYSAGGFGTALLTDDVMSLYENCGDVTCMPDSGVFSYHDWHGTAVGQWGAPKEICDRIHSDNITLDCLLDLHRKHGDKVKIAFGCSYRDALLAQCQAYVGCGKMIFSEEYGDEFQRVLADTVKALKAEIPDVALYIFDKPHPEVTVGRLTEHTFVAADFIFDFVWDGVKAIDWAYDAVCGKPEQIGLKLLGL